MSTQPSAPRTILVVDDEPNLRRLLVRQLEHRGYHVLQAQHGLEALRIYRAALPPVDLVLADVVMPEMNGMQLAAALLDEDPLVRFILISGYVPSGSARLSSGMLVPVLQKPFNLDDVLEVLERVLAAAPSREVGNTHLA
jgi:two-component system cell cycle sensor histidine kinase/response regulator CckA